MYEYGVGCDARLSIDIILYNIFKNVSFTDLKNKTMKIYLLIFVKLKNVYILHSLLKKYVFWRIKHKWIGLLLKLSAFSLEEPPKVILLITSVSTSVEQDSSENPSCCLKDPDLLF